MTPEQEQIAIQALHKLWVEIGRETASPRYEYEVAFAMLDELLGTARYAGPQEHLSRP